MRRWGWALLACAVAAAYLSSLTGAFVFDDEPAILTNPTLRHPADVGRLLLPPGDQAGTVGGRPVLNASLALNYAWGGTDPVGYHVVNLIIHLLAVLTLYGILRRTPGAEAWAGWAALLWGLHPLLTQAVTYVVQRGESLMGLFYLLTLYAFIRGGAAGVGGGDSGGRTQRARLSWSHRGSVLCCWLGMATKEPMVSAPLLVLAYDRTFVAGSFRAAWRARRGYYLALAASWLLLAGLVASTDGRGGSAGWSAGVGVWPYLLTQAWAIAHYLRLSVWPAPLVFDYGVRLAPTLAEVWPQAALIAALLGATAWALVRKPRWGLLGLWFFAILAPSSSVIPIATEPIAEQRMYLPLAALVAALVAVAARWLPRRSVAAGALLLGAALGLATSRRDRQYRDPVTLWTDTVAKNPAEPRAHNNLGTALRARGDARAAQAQFAEAIRLRPDYAPAQFNLGVALLDARRPADALPHLERARAAPRHQADLQLDLGQAYAALGRYGDAVTAFRRATVLAPTSAEAHGDLGNALLLAGRAPEAIAEYGVALALRPGDAALRRNLAVATESARAGR